MDYTVPRIANPVPGALLSPEIFQIAYVTSDIARAEALFRETYGIAAFTPMDSPMPQGGTIRIRLAWLGKVTLELIEADGPGSELYRSLLPATGFAVRHHHFGFLVRDDAEWDALHRTFESQGKAPAALIEVPDMLRASYVEAPELGHYLEYIQLHAAGRALFDAVARN